MLDFCRYNTSFDVSQEEKDGSIIYHEPLKLHIPVAILHPDLLQIDVGDLRGRWTRDHIGLSSPAFIGEITIDHVSKELSHSVDDTSREMEIWAPVQVIETVGGKSLRHGFVHRTRILKPLRFNVPSGLGRIEWTRLKSFSCDFLAPAHIQTFRISNNETTHSLRKDRSSPDQDTHKLG